MSRTFISSLCLVLVAFIAAGGAYMLQAHAATQSSSNTIHVRWLLAHQPTDVFRNATQVFGETLSRESNGRMVLDVVTPQEIGFSETGDIPYTKVIALLDSRSADVSNVYSVAAVQHDTKLGIVNVPFLFNSYTSASKVFDGPIGAGLLTSLSDLTSIRALAFTYSGGYRVIASDKKEIKNLADLKGLRIATSGGPVAEAYFRSLGAVPVALDLESGPSTLSDIDAVETTYSRLSAVLEKNTSFTKYIAETNHSLFTTIMVTNDSFYDSLSIEDRAALQKAAVAAAQIERKDSIALGASTKSALIQKGSIVFENISLQDELRTSAQEVHAQFDSQFGAETIRAIQQAQK